MSSVQPEPPRVHRGLVSIAVLSSAVMEVLDTSVVNVSLPHVAGSLSATADEATWVLTSYIVANAVILPLLVLFRVLKGTTGGGLQPTSQAVLLEEFPLAERGKAMAMWGMGTVAAPILGPVLGGWITDACSWRWVFFINVPVGSFSIVTIALFVEDPPYTRRGSLKVDAIALGMLAVGMGSLQVMLDRGQEEDWFASRTIAVLAVFAVVFLVGFVIRELIVPDPIVRFRLLRYRNFAMRLLLVFVLGFAVAAVALFGFSRMTLDSGTSDILLHQLNQGMGCPPSSCR